MLLWIVIYSFFLTKDFVDEVVILFGGITFWATVLLTASVALAPRFLVKFFTTVYTPLDKDIVREMWVMGDLKDQLGLKHRRAKKIPKSKRTTPEAAPMFQAQHNRSLTEMSNMHDRYEPVVNSSPGPQDLTRQTYLDTPPMSQANDLHIPNVQYTHVRNDLSRERLSPIPASPAGDRYDINPSPQPSYYSASALPPQSPLPPSKYKLSTGEITDSPPPSSRRTSLATIRASEQRPISPPSPIPLPRSPNTLQVPGAPHSPGTIEMQMRDTRHWPNDHEPHYGYDHERSGSSASYNSVADGYWTAEDDYASTSIGHGGRPHSHSSSATEDDDRTVGHSDEGHRHAAPPDWETGYAL
ncbi:hypothetical protein C0993_009142 [Termitomyces sp. T159_Od127]|nr:hypothetical protein C0993_009142 [Termitomyces sp. T159_Od127]